MDLILPMTHGVSKTSREVINTLTSYMHIYFIGYRKNWELNCKIDQSSIKQFACDFIDRALLAVEWRKRLHSVKLYMEAEEVTDGIMRGHPCIITWYAFTVLDSLPPLCHNLSHFDRPLSPLWCNISAQNKFLITNTKNVFFLNSRVHY